MARQWMTPEGFVIDEDGTDEYILPVSFVINEDQTTVVIATDSLIAIFKRRRR